MSLINEDGGRRLSKTHVAMVRSQAVNGVAAIHTDLMKSTIFRDFNEYYPGKISNKTNGVTPRRWLHLANPGLSALISSRIGSDWPKDLDQPRKLAPYASDAAFRREFAAVKRANKERLADFVQRQLGVQANPDSLIDVHVKRIHEYNRQLLTVLLVITLYNRIRQCSGAPRVPRTVIFAGKAAPGYAMAKKVIKLINDVADIVNNDPAIGEQLK